MTHIISVPPAIQKIINNRPYQKSVVGLSASDLYLFSDYVLKIETINEESQQEYKVMSWLQGKLPVPNIIETAYSDTHQYLLMSRLNGQMAEDKQFLQQPDVLIKTLAQGLKKLWLLDTQDCPFLCDLDYKLELAQKRIEQGLCDIEDAETGTYGEEGFADPAALLMWLKDNRPSETLVFSHGDYCFPNIFIENNDISGFIDLGRAGLSDAYQDIALCYRSILHDLPSNKSINNYTNLLFDELNLTPDWDKIRYYILLDELF